MILVIVVSGLGAWPLSYAIAGETSSLRLRARSQGLSWFVNTISNALLSGVLPFLYNPDAANLKGKLGFIFFGLSSAATVIAWWCVPEMKGLSPTEVDHLFESGAPARYAVVRDRSDADSA